MNRRIIGIAALVASLFAPIHSLAELPIDYMKWIFIDKSSIERKITYRESMRSDARVVREVGAYYGPEDGSGIPFTVIGYTKQSSRNPAEIKLEIDVKLGLPGNTFPFSDDTPVLESTIKREGFEKCSKCHIVVNDGYSA